jgi:hypothetical protein
MPKYLVKVLNVSDSHSREPFVIGHEQQEICEAPDPETVEQIVRKDISRTANPDDYSWTITQID